MAASAIDFERGLVTPVRKGWPGLGCFGLGCRLLRPRLHRALLLRSGLAVASKCLDAEGVVASCGQVVIKLLEVVGRLQQLLSAKPGPYGAP